MTLVPNETEQALNRQYDVYAAAREEYRKKIAELAAENERLRAALDLYREAVRIDATMESPKFMGSNASALKRAWDADRAALEGKQ